MHTYRHQHLFISRVLYVVITEQYTNINSLTKFHYIQQHVSAMKASFRWTEKTSLGRTICIIDSILKKILLVSRGVWGGCWCKPCSIGLSHYSSIKELRTLSYWKDPSSQREPCFLSRVDRLLSFVLP